ncbi:Uncharacterised protein [Dorea longicatena]|nr:Uncharacterised protein [Dorea longicatena]
MDTKQKLRNEILRNLEKNSRIDLGELAVLMGMEEAGSIIVCIREAFSD